MGKIESIIELSKLIAKDISGKLSPVERDLLAEWLRQSVKNQEIYERIRSSRNLTERNLIYDRINREMAWGKVSSSLGFQAKKRIWPRLLKYAAAFLLPVILGIATYQYLNDEPQKIIQPIVEIQPGSRHAVLVMADGKSIDLVNDTAKNLVEKDGTLIRNNDDELSYSGQSAKSSKKQVLNTLIVPRGGEYNLVLSDGTRVLVNSMSKLVFPVKFSGNKREITLVEGEAFFEVAKDKTKPFLVTVEGVQVEVLGTAFNIKAYPEDECSYTTLVEGKVKLNPENKASKIQYLEPDQQAIFNPLSSGLKIEKVDAKQIIQWTAGKYSFTNQPLDEIMKTLARWYDFDYKFEDESLKKIRFEGGLNKYESVVPILDIINKTGKVKVLVKGKDVTFIKIY